MSSINSTISVKKFESLNIFFKKYSDLFSSVTILVNDTLFLLGETLSSFPKIVGNSSFVILNIAGLLSLSFQFDLLKKTINDLKFSKKMHNHRIFFITIVKTFFLLSTIILLNLSFLASVFKFYGKLQQMTNIYQITKPYASFCIFTSIILDCFHYYTNKKIINQNILEKDIKLLTNIYKNEKPDFNKKINLLSAEIRERMDKDTWKSFINNLKKSSNNLNQKKIFENVAIKNIKTQSTINFSSLALKSMGYFAMLLCAWYPATLIQASVFTLMSSLYTIQLSYQKYMQRKQQITASQISYV